MSKYKKIIAIILVVAIMYIMVLPSFAVVTLSYWDSSSNEVAYRTTDGSYFLSIQPNSGTFTSNMNAALIRATNQWCSRIPVNIFSASANYAINHFFAGNLDFILSSEPSFPTHQSSDGGLQPSALGMMKPPSIRHFVDNAITPTGNTVSIYKYTTGCSIFILNMGDDWPLNKYKDTVMHEIGHMLGWIGHSSIEQAIMNSSDIYYTDSLLISDVRHILQIYNLYN